MLLKAIEIAHRAHEGQSDKNGQPYILHPLRVMNSGKTYNEMIVGILHDVIEDSDYTLEDLKKEKFSEEILAAVDAMTKKENQAYQEYLDNLKNNSLAVRVKQNDLTDNMDLKRLSEISDEDIPRLRKYLKAYNELKQL